MTPILVINNLTLAFQSLFQHTPVLHGISLSIAKGEKVALVGESGSGKSVTARIILGLLQETVTAEIGGEVWFEGRDINTMRKAERAALRGTDMSMIFQDPTSSLNPNYTIRSQFVEVLRRRTAGLSRGDCDERMISLLEEVRIPDPLRVLEAYPFQLSGGMNQRVMIAMALANRPKLLLADEPGTALDVSVQAQTLSLMHHLVDNHQTAVLFISHNLGVVREFVDRVYVIFRGRIVEYGSTGSLFAGPLHPYTQALMAAVPRITGSGLPDLPEISDTFLAPPVNHGGTL